MGDLLPSLPLVASRVVIRSRVTYGEEKPRRSNVLMLLICVVQPIGSSTSRSGIGKSDYRCDLKGRNESSFSRFWREGAMHMRKRKSSNETWSGRWRCFVSSDLAAHRGNKGTIAEMGQKASIGALEQRFVASKISDSNVHYWSTEDSGINTRPVLGKAVPEVGRREAVTVTVL